MSFNFLEPSQTDADWHPLKADLAYRNAVILDERNLYRPVLEQARMIHQLGVPYLQSDQYYQEKILPLREQYVKIRRNYLQSFQPVAATPEPISPDDERERQRLVTEELTRNEQREKHENQQLAQLDQKTDHLQQVAEEIKGVTINNSFNSQVGLQTFDQPTAQGAGESSGLTWMEHVRKVKSENPRQDGELFKNYLKRVMPIAKQSYVRRTTTKTKPVAKARPKGRPKKVSFSETIPKIEMDDESGGVLVKGQDPENPSDEKVINEIKALYDKSYEPETTTTTETALTPNPNVISNEKSAAIITEQAPPSSVTPAEQAELKSETETENSEDELLEGGQYRVPKKMVTWPQFLQHLRRQIPRQPNETGRQYLSRVTKIASAEYKRYQLKRHNIKQSQESPITKASAVNQKDLTISSLVEPSHRNTDQIAEIKDKMAYKENDKHQSKRKEIADIDTTKKTISQRSQLINNKLNAVAKTEKKGRQLRVQRATPRARENRLKLLLQNINLSDDDKLKMIREVISTNVQQSAYRDSEALLERLLRDNPNALGDTTSISNLKHQDNLRRQKEEASKNIEFKTRLITEYPELLDAVRERFPGLKKEGIVSEIYKLSIEEIEDLIKPTKNRREKIKLINKNPVIVNQFVAEHPAEGTKSTEIIYNQLLDLDKNRILELIRQAKAAKQRASRELASDVRQIGDQLLDHQTVLEEIIDFRAPEESGIKLPTEKDFGTKVSEILEETAAPPPSIETTPSVTPKRGPSLATTTTTTTTSTEPPPTPRSGAPVAEKIASLEKKTETGEKPTITKEELTKIKENLLTEIKELKEELKTKEILPIYKTKLEKIEKKVVGRNLGPVKNPGGINLYTRYFNESKAKLEELKKIIEAKETGQKIPITKKSEKEGSGYSTSKIITARDLAARRVKTNSKRRPKL